MNQVEFEERLEQVWRQRYALYNPETDHWTVERQDTHAKQQYRDMLLQYGRDVQVVGVSRHGKNKAQRLFDELGIDPTQLELDEFGVLDKPSTKGRPRSAGAFTRSCIMYIERKAGNLTGEAHIGRVTFSKSRRSLSYGGRSFHHLKGFKANFYCVETGEEYWISGCKRDGSDRLYGERIPIHIDEDVRAEYWTQIRGLPE